MRTAFVVVAAALVGTAGCAVLENNDGSQPKPLRFVVVDADYRALAECVAGRYPPATATLSADESAHAAKVAPAGSGTGAEITFSEAGVHRTAIDVSTDRVNRMISDENRVRDAWEKIDTCMAQPAGQ